MARWVVGLGLWVGCVLWTTGCRRHEPGETVPAASEPIASEPTAATTAPSEPPPTQPLVVDLPELSDPSAEPSAPSEPVADASGTDTEPPPSRLLLTDSADWEWPERGAIRTTAEDDDRAWVREAAEAARDSATSGATARRLEEVTIATGTVDGRVRRVRPGTIEVSDGEGNIYELRIDGRSRALRRGRHISMKSLAEGMPVRASFDLVGDGESLARDIELRR